MSLIESPPIQRPSPPVATIIDDDPQGRAEIAFRVRRAGWEPRAIDHSYGSDIDGLLRDVESGTNVVICDQWLNGRNYLATAGINVARRLRERHIPTILISQSIRDIAQYSGLLPTMSRDDLGVPGALTENLTLSRSKTYEAKDVRERFYRTIVRTVGLDREAGIVNFLVTGWDSNDNVTVELRLIPPKIESGLKIGDRLLARGNLHAPSAADLVIRDFETGPSMNPDDGLA